MELLASYSGFEPIVIARKRPSCKHLLDVNSRVGEGRTKSFKRLRITTICVQTKTPFSTKPMKLLEHRASTALQRTTFVANGTATQIFSALELKTHILKL